jgi:Zn-dependent protease
MTNTSKLKGGRNGLALVALAGPGSNVVMAVILAIMARIALHVAPAFAEFAANGVELSLYLAIFNLLPVPPLDGSKLLLAMRVPMVVYQEIARFGFMLLVLAISVYGVGRWMAEWSDAGTRAIFQALG